MGTGREPWGIRPWGVRPGRKWKRGDPLFVRQAAQDSPPRHPFPPLGVGILCHLHTAPQLTCSHETGQASVWVSQAGLVWDTHAVSVDVSRKG